MANSNMDEQQVWITDEGIIYYQMGMFKQLEDITIVDMKEHPIWVNDLSGENEDGFDETSMRPIRGDINLTKKFASQFLTLSILLKSVDSDIYAIVDYTEDGTFSNLYAWKDENWIQAKDVFPTRDIVFFIAIPQIEGQTEAIIGYNLESDIGTLKESE